MDARSLLPPSGEDPQAGYSCRLLGAFQVLHKKVGGRDTSVNSGWSLAFTKYAPGTPSTASLLDSASPQTTRTPGSSRGRG